MSGPDVRVKPATSRLGVICGTLLGRSFRKKSSNDMAFPHPQSRKDHYRKEDIPSWGGIARKFFKRTINITEYRNAKDDVNPAKNRALGGIIHGRLRERGRCIVLRDIVLQSVDSRPLSRLGRPAGRFNAELLCVLGVQSLPAAELHGLGADDASTSDVKCRGQWAASRISCPTDHVVD